MIEGMYVRTLEARDGQAAVVVEAAEASSVESSWVWIDIDAGPEDTEALVEFTSSLNLDALAVRDAVDDFDLPKIDDFGSSVLVILHGLAEHQVSTYELDCFLSERRLVTIRRRPSPSLELVWSEVQRRPELTSGGPDELLARLADVVSRRLLSVLDEFDNRVEELVAKALEADPFLVGEVTAVRGDLAVLRRTDVPQREALDLLRHSTSPLLTDAGRRRFSDVFDVASRAVSGVDAARTALGEVLDAYRGAEARQATEVAKVLTMYAAIMLPLSLITGFFGMNFKNLPGIGDENGWVLVTGAMAVVALVSLGIFVALGWIRRPSVRGAGSTLGRGLVEAARAPVEIVGAAFEISTMPLRTAADTRRNRRPPDSTAQQT